MRLQSSLSNGASLQTLPARAVTAILFPGKL
jgi:hypothetical protein